MNSVLKTGTMCLLIVDDDEVDRRALHRLLGDEYKLIEADTGPQAAWHLRAQPIDCVLLDYRIPGLDTLDLLETCVQLQIPVVMLTREGNEAIAVEAMKRGASDYLAKDHITQSALRRSVGNAIEKGTLARRVRDQQQELEAFVSTAAHDLRAPLRTIATHCQLVQVIAPDTLDEEAQESLDTAVEQALELVQLIDSLLVYTQVGRSAKPPEPVDLHELVHSVIDALESTIEESQGQIEVDHLPTVQGDPIGLRQVLQNLLANALKFKGAGLPQVRLAADLHEGLWYIRVIDKGIGIAPAHHRQIFQPLKRLNNSHDYEGAGLGLAVCERIVRHHGGRIWVESEAGQGATFTFTLPEK